jgi:integrase
MPLTDAAIRAALKSETRRKITDSAGLYLLINPPREPGWRLKYRIAGREKLLSLGRLKDVPLRRAREKRDEARRLIADGVDPSAARKAAKLAHADSFVAVAEEWLATRKDALTQGSWERDREHLVNFLKPIANRPIATIEAPDLLSILRSIEAKGTRDTAHRVRSVASRVFRYAIATGRATRDVAADLKGALLPVLTESYSAITEPQKLGQLLRAIEEYPGQPTTHVALRMAPYVFLRPGELRGAEWKEIDLDGAEWRIPGERMKMGELHIVPLARQVVALFREIQPLTSDGRFVFPALHTSLRPISENTLNMAIRRIGYGKDEMCSHGFRSTASTLLNEQGHNPDLIELQLAHAERNKVRAAYNRAQRLDERRKMMQAWADYLDQLKVGGDGQKARV